MIVFTEMRCASLPDIYGHEGEASAGSEYELLHRASCMHLAQRWYEAQAWRVERSDRNSGQRQRQRSSLPYHKAEPC